MGRCWEFSSASDVRILPLWTKAHSRLIACRVDVDSQHFLTHFDGIQTLCIALGKAMDNAATAATLLESSRKLKLLHKVALEVWSLLQGHCIATLIIAVLQPYR